MGGSAIVVALRAREKALSPQRAAAALRTALLGAWRMTLPTEWHQTAEDWIADHPDALLTIDVVENDARFWFYDSVEWPLGVAEHWLRVALTRHRRHFEWHLDRAGYGLELDERMSFSSVRQRAFIEAEGSIGEVRGSAVEWHIRAPGRGGSTPIAELDAVARAAVDELQATAICRCPMCRHAFRASVEPTITTMPGYRATKVDFFEDRKVTELAFTGSGWIRVTEGNEDKSVWRIAHAAAIGGAWRPSFESSKYQVLAMNAQADGRIVAQVRAGSDRYGFMSSNDGGLTFAPPVDHDATLKLSSISFWNGRTDSEMWTTGKNKRVFRSIDCGRSFEAIATGGRFANKPVHRIDGCLVPSPARPERLMALVSTKSGKTCLATTEDGGAQFHLVAGVRDQRRDLSALGNTLVSFAWDYDTATAFVAHSLDDGETWNEHALGRAFVGRPSIGPKGLLVPLSKSHSRGLYDLLFSPDGIRFENCVSIDCDQWSFKAFVDPTGESVGYFFAKPWLYRLEKL